MRKRSIWIKGSVAMVALAFLSSAAWAGTATDQLKATLTQLVEVLRDPKLKTPGKAGERRAALHKVLEARFDEEALARGALKKHWASLNPQEKKEFVAVFIALLEQTYFRMIDEELKAAGPVSGDNIHYVRERVRGSHAYVETKIIGAENSETPVVFRLRNKAGTWLVVDMAIEGVVVTRNYRAQFDEILAASPFSELLTRLKAKQK